MKEGIIMQEKDFNWFLEHYDELFKRYGVAFLAIKDKKVIGIYDNYADAVKQTGKVEKPGTFIIQECNGNESAYTNNIATICFS